MDERSRREFLAVIGGLSLGFGGWILHSERNDLVDSAKNKLGLKDEKPPVPPTKEMPEFTTASTNQFTEEERKNIEEFTLDEVNIARFEEGAGQIKRYSNNLAYIARLHSRDMAEEGYVAHEDQGLIQYGEYHYQRLGYFGYRAGVDFDSVENISAFSVDEDITAKQIAEKTVDGLLQSPPHREAILNPDYDTYGAGCHLYDYYSNPEGQTHPRIHVHLTQLFTGPNGRGIDDPEYRS